ncbi:hypothetical protein [Ulvibacterium sp.]
MGKQKERPTPPPKQSPPPSRKIPLREEKRDMPKPNKGGGGPMAN